MDAKKEWFTGKEFYSLIISDNTGKKRGKNRVKHSSCEEFQVLCISPKRIG